MGYSVACKFCCKKFLTFVSLLIFLVGGACCYFGAMTLIEMPIGFPDIIDIDHTMTGYLVIGFGGVAILVSFLGCCTARCMRPVFAAPFVLLTFIIGIVMAVVGLILSGWGAPAFQIIMSQVCEESSQ